MGCGRSFSSVQDEMRTSTDSSRDQAECNHHGHVLLEQLTVICVSCGFRGDNGLMSLITENSLVL